MFRKYIVKGLSNRALRHGKSLALRIGTVAHQCQYTFLSDFRKPLQVNGISEYRRVVHFKVTGMHHDSRWGIDRQRGRILDAVVCLDKFYTKAAQINGLSMFDHFSLGASEQIVLFKFVFDQSDRKLCCVNGYIDLLHHIRKCTDMVLMAMGDNESFDFVNIVLQISDVRYHKVNSQHIVLGK